MTVPLLLEHFDELISTPEDVEKLNRSILQLAMQGKLVEQNPNDETVSDLLENLAKIKLTAGTKSSRIKGNITNHRAVPFDLPKSWEWATLGDVCLHPQYGWTTKASSLGNLYFVRTTDISFKEEINWGTVPYCEKEPEDAEKYLLQNDDILISRAGSVGISLLVKEPKQAIFASYLIRFKPIINAKYIALFLKSPLYWQSISDNVLGIAVPNVNATRLSQIAFPLPPLAEQGRIVARIEELFAQTRLLAEELSNSRRELDRLNESALERLLASETQDEFNERWGFVAEHFDLLTSAPEHIAPLRQSILELAVRGKLTRREAGDGKIDDYLREIELERSRFSEENEFKKDKPLPSIQEDEIRFEIPENWKWVRLNDICVKITDGFHETPIPTETGYPYVLATHVKSNGIDFNNCFYVSEVDHKRLFAKATPRKGDVLVVSIGAGSATPAMIEVDFEFSFKNVAILNKASNIDTKYLFYYLLAIKQSVFDEITRGGAQPYLSLKMLKNLVFPLAPLAEQERIVKRVEALLGWCDALEAQLMSAEEERGRLVESVLSQVGGRDGE